MQAQAIDDKRFIELVRPALESNDAEALAVVCGENWTADQICDLMRHGSTEARRICCLTLGLVACRKCICCLAHALKDDDAMLGELAERAMWSIWFRSGSDESQPHFARGLTMMEEGNFAEAIKSLNRATMTDPQFAEAHNQRAICFFLLEDWKRSLEAAMQAMELEPNHFGALAGMGHCYAQVGRLVDAARCYRRALRINPRMDAISGALERIQAKLDVPAPGQTGTFPAIS